MVDREVCIECGKCAKVCPLSALHPESQPWKSIPPHDPVEYDCDLCVIGGGGGGLTAAARFAWLTGKKVVVVEKMRSCGGQAWFASTMRMYNSQWQKDRGVKDVLGEKLVEIMDQTYWLLDSHLVRNALKGTGEWFDWLGEVDPDRDSKFVEFAAKLGVPADNLRETIRRYNEMCAQARDDDFFKGAEDLVPFGEGPYFAVSGGVGTDGAFGGVRVNENIQAYAADRKTLIENLYVPGDFASGRFLNMAGYKVQIINDLSWAMSSGFIAGSHAAKALSEN